MGQSATKERKRQMLQQNALEHLRAREARVLRKINPQQFPWSSQQRHAVSTNVDGLAVVATSHQLSFSSLISR